MKTMNASRFPSALRDLLIRCGLLLCLAVLLWAAVTPLPLAQAAVLQSPLSSCPPNTSCAPDPKPPICSILPNDPRCAPGGGGGGPTCTAPGGGSPNCGGSGPASVGGGGSGGVSVGGGNPINLLSGNKYQEETDLPALPGVLGLELKRYYNSDASYPGLAGANWHTSYETVLYDLGSQVQIVQADGRRITLQRGVGGNARLCTSAQLQDGQVRIEQQGNEPVYHWRWADGRTLSFRAVGPATGGYPLHEIRAATGERMQLAYNPLGDLIRVTDPQGRKLELIYGKAASGRRAPLQAALTPLGRIGYQHDPQGRLTAVSQHALGKDGQPQASAYVTRLYHYEAQYNGGYGFLLTGISVQAPTENQGAAQRLSTYAYDAQGRAVLSTKGLPAEGGKADAAHGIEQVRVEYLRKPSPNEGRPDKSGEMLIEPQKLGLVRLTNSLGQTSELKTAVIGGQFRLIEFTGPGCSTCGPSNRRYAYDAEGRLVRSVELDTKGQPLRAELYRYDTQGRQVETAQQGYQAGKPQAPQWRQRLEYTDTRFKDGSTALGLQPTRIEQPSVVPGKSRVTEVDYNPFGQLTRVTERGWSPIDAEGSENSVAIERSTAYRYTTIAGKSVLTEVDGPLPNGPKGDPSDSDVTRFGWDTEGLRVVAVLKPGGERHDLRYDSSTGRVAEVQNDVGVRTQFSYDPSGQPARLQTWAPGLATPAVQTIQYDALGRAVEWGRGTPDEADYRGQMRAAYDLADRLVWRATVQGLLEQLRFDTEGQLLQRTLAMGRQVQTEAQAFDVQGRLVQIRTSQGPGLELDYDERGQLSRVTDALGRQHLRGSATVPGDRPDVPRVRQARDDWGRVVRTRSPDAGQTLRSFDATDRLVAAQDALGNRASYAYDLRGRILEQQIVAAQPGAVPQLTRWIYRGRDLEQVQHPTQSEFFSRDEAGRVVAKQVRRPKASGQSELVALTRYRYEASGPAQGELAGQTLPDGSWLLYKRDALGQVVALERERLSHPALRWLLPTQVLASDIQRDIVGLRHLKSGNGLVSDWLRSREGNLARLVVHDPRHINQAEADRRYARLMEMLSVANAQALAQPEGQSQTAVASAGAASAPGALGAPLHAGALLDHRYLWDAQGNLLLNAERQGRTQAAYAYDMRDRLVIEALLPDAPEPGLQTVSALSLPAQHSRWLYDAAGRRVLQQQGQADADELQQGTQRTLYEPGTHRWRSAVVAAGESKSSLATAASEPSRYNALGLPLQLSSTGANGQPRTRRFEWDALGRLSVLQAQAADGTPTQARYTYSHRGERIAKWVGTGANASAGQGRGYLYDEAHRLVGELDAQGRLHRQIVYAADLPLALIDTPEGSALVLPPAQGDPSLGDDLARVWRAWFGPSETLTWLHVNHLGAVELATDGDGKPVGQASYNAHGALLQAHGPLRLDLRLPGQVFDAENGLHYNGQRYYDPERGEYLTPDPLGTPDGPNAYAYVRGNPLRYVDPDGLLLFAFDGTGNTDNEDDLKKLGNGLSNVVKFRDLYDDGNFRYVTGVGTVDRSKEYGDLDPADYARGKLCSIAGKVSGDMGCNYSGPARIDRMVQYLQDEAESETDDDKALDIDIIGFSRGAAQARDFANRIVNATKDGVYKYTIKVDGKDVTHCQKVNFRFMGLFDTVLSTNRSGYSYQLSIPDAFAHVSHAVALNEYRGRTVRGLLSSVGAFPLESIRNGPSSPVLPDGKTRTEMGFVGSHADIGGGFARDNELSRVALAWMVEQATFAGIKMRKPEGDDASLPSNPVLHDKSDNQFCTDPTNPTCSEDRDVHYQGGSGTKQRDMAFSTGLDYATIRDQGFISYYPATTDAEGRPVRIPRSDYSTGAVDAKKYVEWLKKNGYGLGGLSVN